MRRLIVLLAVLAATLAGAIGLELQPDTLDDDAMSARPTRQPAPTAGRPPVFASELRQEWVAGILARPLFSPDRRPAAVAATGAAVARSLPRLTAILLDGPRRQVIFAGVGDGRPRVVAEGGELDGFRVQTVEAGQATIVGPDGAHVVRPSFDPAPPAVPAPGAAVQPSGLPNLSGLTGIPGLPVAR